MISGLPAQRCPLDQPPSSSASSPWTGSSQPAAQCGRQLQWHAQAPRVPPFPEAPTAAGRDRAMARQQAAEPTAETFRRNQQTGRRNSTAGYPPTGHRRHPGHGPGGRSVGRLRGTGGRVNACGARGRRFSSCMGPRTVGRHAGAAADRGRSRLVDPTLREQLAGELAPHGIRWDSKCTFRCRWTGSRASHNLALRSPCPSAHCATGPRRHDFRPMN